MASTKGPSDFKTSSTKQIESPSYSRSKTNIQNISEITKKAIIDNFSHLREIPGILYLAMAIWGLESNWRLLFDKGSVIDSAHYSPADPKKSFVGKDYYYTAVISALRSRPDLTEQTKKNIDQGLVAHGLSACMGCYHVRGTDAYNYMFKNKESLAMSKGIVVNPGESITDLFADPTNNWQLGKERSIIAGLIVLENKFLLASKMKTQGGSLRYPSKEEAIKAAVGFYVGKLGAKDINGYSPEQRIAEVYQDRKSKLVMLAEAGITKNTSLTTGYTEVTQVATTNSGTGAGTSIPGETTPTPTKNSIPGCPAIA